MVLASRGSRVVFACTAKLIYVLYCSFFKSWFKYKKHAICGYFFLMFCSFYCHHKARKTKGWSVVWKAQWSILVLWFSGFNSYRLKGLNICEIKCMWDKRVIEMKFVIPFILCRLILKQYRYKKKRRHIFWSCGCSTSRSV